jgi:hypothetical protein
VSPIAERTGDQLPERRLCWLHPLVTTSNALSAPKMQKTMREHSPSPGIVGTI